MARDKEAGEGTDKEPGKRPARPLGRRHADRSGAGEGARGAGTPGAPAGAPTDAVPATAAEGRAFNVLGGPLLACSFDPLTGFFRDGCCHTGPQDLGSHTVCARVTEAFLSFSLERGNDLVTPRPEYRFRGLKPGDRWCVCAARWMEAHEAGVAPPVVLEATHQAALRLVPLQLLLENAWDSRSSSA